MDAVGCLFVFFYILLSERLSPKESTLIGLVHSMSMCCLHLLGTSAQLQQCTTHSNLNKLPVSLSFCSPLFIRTMVKMMECGLLLGHQHLYNINIGCRTYLLVFVLTELGNRTSSQYLSSTWAFCNSGWREWQASCEQSNIHQLRENQSPALNEKLKLSCSPRTFIHWSRFFSLTFTIAKNCPRVITGHLGQ